jgi:hypothetical protein
MPGNAYPLNNPGADHRSSNAQERLEELGFRVEEARSFIYENMMSLEFIYEICLTFGIDTDMIAEIMDLENVDGSAIANFFASNGIDPAGLSGSAATIDVVAGDEYDETEEESEVEEIEDDETEEESEVEEIEDDETEEESEVEETEDDETEEESEVEATEATVVSEEDAIDVVYDGVYSGTISSTGDTISFEGIIEATVLDDEVNAAWSIDELGVSGTLYGVVDNETGSFTLTDDNSEFSYGLTITGVTSYETSTGTWSSGFFGGNFEAIFIG